MSVQSHVVELRKKHQHLSDEVERAQRLPGSDDLAGGCPGHPRDDQPATSPLSFTKGNTKGKTS